MRQDRRDFMKFMLAAAASSIWNCAGLSTRFTPAHKDLGELLDGFNIYQGTNPNVPFRQEYTFYTKMMGGRTGIGRRNPGPAWDAYGPIVAAATGYVTRVQSIKGTNGGYRVQIGNSVAPIYHVTYDHIFSPRVTYASWQKVKRGDVIGDSAGYFKMILYNYFNTQNPDLYGLNHDYMDYWNGETDYSVEDSFNKRENQREVIRKVVINYEGEHRQNLFNLANFGKVEHRQPSRYKQFLWSEIERFRLLEHLYNKDPKQFELSQYNFQNLKHTFYENQPIILTLPFKK